MEIVNGFFIFYTMLILLQFASYLKTECPVNEHKVLTDGHHVFIQDNVEPFYKPINWTDRSKCFRLCALETFCHIWTFQNGKCQIFHSMIDKLKVINTNDPSLKTYYETEEDDEWFKMYFVKSGSEFKVVSSFLGVGTYDSWGPTKCTHTLCSDLFRSNLIDAWNTLPIQKVKMLARKNNKDVVTLIFDGQKSTKENWFSKSRVLESSWENFTNETPTNKFGIEVDNYRKFYISSYHNKCADNKGWFMVTGYVHECDYEKKKPYPQILYTNKTTFTTWSQGFETADDFAIFVSFSTKQ